MIGYFAMHAYMYIYIRYALGTCGFHRFDLF